MYLLSVLLLMAVFPALSIAIEHASAPQPWLPLVGKWYVFWGAGMRLFLAGLRQVVRPAFTSETIFGIKGPEVLPMVRELGIANLALGAAGLCSIARPGFVPAIGLVAGLFYAMAGVRHMSVGQRTPHQTIAGLSDLVASAVFGLYLIGSGLR